MRTNAGWTATRTALIGAGAALTLQGCTALSDAVGRSRGTDKETTPVGVGPRDTDLKRSPCACLELPFGPDGRVRGPAEAESDDARA